MIRTEYYKDLTKMNTFGMKVKARCFMEYDSVADLVDIEFAELARPVLHIGGGSNLLFTDDFKGTVLHSRIDFIEILDEGEEVLVSVPSPTTISYLRLFSRGENQVLISIRYQNCRSTKDFAKKDLFNQQKHIYWPFDEPRGAPPWGRGRGVGDG